MEKVAYITGASSGLGEEFCRQLARDGFKVGMIARRQEPMAALTEELGSRGHDLRYYPCDVLDFDELKKAYAFFEAELGPPSLLIANAGVGVSLSLRKFDQAKAKAVIDVNLIGVMNTVAAALPGMIERRAGHIVAISSLGSFIAPPKDYVYSASKAALNTYMKGMSLDAEPYNITVTTVCPGFIKTPMTQEAKVKMPLLMEPEDAVKLMLDGIYKKKRDIIFPMRLYYLVKILNNLPRFIQKKIFP